ncbi:MAG TPA: 2TM domain-containing protein [Mycobacteriales bacterium]|nr:2TM domain-containing protein [Mycobacteriales bacterium]
MPTSTVVEESGTPAEVTARDRAVRQLKKKRDFHAHLLVYALVNSCLVLVWFTTGRHGFFWPVFFIAFWGIGVVMNAWDVYHGEEFSEEQIEREMRRLSS